ncbi:phage protein [Staphylococcus aureus]|nr:phage protein [Staphylococcus aureus]
MNYETGVQLGVMDARLKKMRKQRDEYKKQRDELIGDIGKLRERNKGAGRRKQVHGIGIARALKKI